MAANKKWGEVLSTLNRGDAGFDDYEGRTPLHVAATHNKTEVAKRLVLHGADLNSKDQGGISSIDLARYLEYPELAEWLKTARTRRNWAEACSLGRATTGALACATFWHAHVGEWLCAPGRKWAESDRAAFEKEFNGHGE